MVWPRQRISVGAISMSSSGRRARAVSFELEFQMKFLELTRWEGASRRVAHYDSGSSRGRVLSVLSSTTTCFPAFALFPPDLIRSPAEWWFVLQYRNYVPLHDLPPPSNRFAPIFCSSRSCLPTRVLSFLSRLWKVFFGLSLCLCSGLVPTDTPVTYRTRCWNTRQPFSP